MGFFRFPYTIYDVFGSMLSKDQIARMDERDRTIEDYLSNDAPAAAVASSGGIIGYRANSPTFPGALTDTWPIAHGGSLTAISSADWSVTFVVPSSGNVLVEVEGTFTGTSLLQLYFGIATSPFAISVTRQATAYQDSVAPTAVRAKVGWVVEGLTPGATITYYWYAFVNGGCTDANLVVSNNGDDSAGGAHMTVQSLP